MMWRYGLAALLVATTGCGADRAGSEPSATARAARHQSTADRRADAAVWDERGHGVVQLSDADNGRVVLVDMGQRLELSLGDGSSAWVPPYLVGPRGGTGQDRPLYLQAATGYPSPGPARARLLAGNPGDVVVQSHRASCGDGCDPSMTFAVRVYVNTLP